MFLASKSVLLILKTAIFQDFIKFNLFEICIDIQVAVIVIMFISRRNRVKAVQPYPENLIGS
jgi:lipoprotein signal peptidase